MTYWLRFAIFYVPCKLLLGTLSKKATCLHITQLVNKVKRFLRASSAAGLRRENGLSAVGYGVWVLAIPGETTAARENSGPKY